MLAAVLLSLAMIQPPNQGDLSRMFATLAEGLAAEEDPAEGLIKERVKALQEAREAQDIKKWLRAAMPRTVGMTISLMTRSLSSRVMIGGGE